jgi:hypothetical protein
MKKILYKTVKHYFPEIRSWIKEIEDPRNINQVTYKMPVMVWIGILFFLFKLESRRQINYILDTEKMIRNISILSKEKIETMIHDGTLAYLLKKLKTENLEELKNKMINRLIRMRCLEDYRLLGIYYLISVDGTGQLVFNYRHCEHCLTKKDKDGKITCYYHNILEAKLVCGNGMVISIATEFIENETPDISKQDCELKAFYRLEKKLKEQFPQLKICLLMDGLYAVQKVFGICKRNNWKYIITFKEGSLPNVYAEYITLTNLEKENKAKHAKEGISQEFRWVNGIDYEDYLLNVLECKEIKNVKNRFGEIEEQQTTFIWLTNIEIDKYNYLSLSNEGGRLRWKIENEGFNMQKNGGYNLEHNFCQDDNAIKNFYLLMQIAHMLNQLMELDSLLSGEIKKKYGSIKNFTWLLLENFRTTVFELAEIQAIESSAFRIHLRGPTTFSF